MKQVTEETLYIGKMTARRNADPNRSGRLFDCAIYWIAAIAKDHDTNLTAVAHMSISKRKRWFPECWEVKSA